MQALYTQAFNGGGGNNMLDGEINKPLILLFLILTLGYFPMDF